MKDLSFCHCVHENSESIAVGKTRRLSITTSSNHVLKRTRNSHFRAIHVFEKGGVWEPFMDKLCSRSRILKVLDMQELRRLHLKARLEKLPGWIPKLEYLVKIRLGLSNLKDDLMQSLKNLPNLLKLSLWENAYDGEILHFPTGGFQKLRELILSHLNRVNSILIEKGALLSLEHLKMEKIPQLEEVPSGIILLDKLKVIDLVDMPNEFVKSIDPDEGHDHWIISHVPLVFIRQWFGPKYYDFEMRTINSSSKEA